jgi:hypothetical protein
LRVYAALPNPAGNELNGGCPEVEYKNGFLHSQCSMCWTLKYDYTR